MLAQGTLKDVDVRTKTGAWKARTTTKGTSDLIVRENRVAPGGHFGWHSHPGPSLVIVKSGTSTFYRGTTQLAPPRCTRPARPTWTPAARCTSPGTRAKLRSSCLS